MKEETSSEKPLNRLLFWSIVIWLMFGQAKFESDSVTIRYNGIMHCLNDTFEQKQNPRRFFELHVK